MVVVVENPKRELMGDEKSQMLTLNVLEARFLDKEI